MENFRLAELALEYKTGNDGVYTTLGKGYLDQAQEAAEEYLNIPNCNPFDFSFREGS